MTKNNKAVFVLIRGLLRESRHWGEFSKTLQQQFPEASILTPDIPGNGCLYQQTSPNNIADLTDALRSQVSQSRQLNLIAISMGGMIAIDWMMRYPDEVSSAVLINTSARPFSPFYQRLRWQTYPTIIKMLCHSKRRQEQDILALTSNRHTHNKELLGNWQRWQQQNPVSAASARNQLLAAATFSITAQPKQPILIVSSSADKLVSHQCSQKIHQQWQTAYQHHATAGHDLPLDEPDWLSGVIGHWFTQLKRGKKLSR